MHPETARTKLGRWWSGVRRNHVNVQADFAPAFFDTEWCFGRVFATGFQDESGRVIYHGLEKDHWRWFVDQCHRLTMGTSATPVVGAHFSRSDLSVLLWDLLNPMGTRFRQAPKRSHFSMIRGPRCTVEIFWGRPNFGRIAFGHRTVHLIDTFSYFSTSLGGALAAIGSPLKKMAKPKQLGRRVIPLAEVTPYLNADLEGGFALLQYILGLHREYKTRLCVSLPALAGRIFRHYYLKKDFPKPTTKLMVASLLSYHGGKNRWPSGKSTWYPKVWSLDKISAFPNAMRQLPDFENGKWAEGRGPKFMKAHPHGIFKVWGWIKPCPWGCLFSHDFKALAGRVNGVWVTSYELKEALRSRELRLTRVEGFGFSTKSKTSAFKAYVDEFFEKKQTAKDPALRYFYKTALNALYGKFIARTLDEEGNRVAGSMFDPAVASLITGYVRAEIHQLEHKYNAIHTATDGILTLQRPSPKDLGSGLGDLKLEHYGPCLILRNKLYLHFRPGTLPGKIKWAKKGPKQNPVKMGFHGFEKARPGESQVEMAKRLVTLWKSPQARKYRIERLTNWSEAWHIGSRPGAPLRRPKILRLPA